MRLYLSVCVVVLGAGTAAAQEPARAVPRRLELTPARPGEPALRRRLLPELVEQHQGNAAERYRKAGQLAKAVTVKLTDTEYAWLNVSLDEFPKAEARALLKNYDKALAEAEAGALCETCDWGLAQRLREKGIGALLPEVQEMRELGSLMQLRSRLELAEGEPLRALRTARTMLVMARHVGESPTLISMLVGVALTSLAAERIEEVMQQPDAPNLYWALSDLPRPFISMREPLQGERLMAYGIFSPKHPEVLFDLDAEPMSREQAQELGKNLTGLSYALSDLPRDVQRRLFGFAVLAKHEVAVKALVAQGRPRAKVEAMPYMQVAVLHALTEYDQELDEAIKWQEQPYWETLPRFKEYERQLKQINRMFVDFRGDRPALPLAGFLLPAIGKVRDAQVRIERRFALLRCIEAIRDYAAAHGGKLPASLAEIKDLPLPLDPVTGRPFPYVVKGELATLSSAPLNGRTDWPSAPAYRLRMRK
jgi:hypothetical protein